MPQTAPNNSTSIGNISPLVMRKLASRPLNTTEFFEELKQSNPEFAEWFLIRLEQLAPSTITTPEERFAQAQLALETIALIDHQATIDQLKKLW